LSASEDQSNAEPVSGFPTFEPVQFACMNSTLLVLVEKARSVTSMNLKARIKLDIKIMSK